jgi:outer membrane protein assembly factor BamB
LKAPHDHFFITRNNFTTAGAEKVVHATGSPHARNIMTTSRVLGLVSVGVLLATRVSSAPWSQYRGPDGDGISQEKIAVKLPADGPKKLWRAETPDGFSSLAVGKDAAFTVITRRIDGAPTEVCIALDAASGKELWATPTGSAKYQGGGDSGAPDNSGGDGPRSTPAVSGDRVYVYSADMMLQCLDAATGKPVWKHNIVAEFGEHDGGWKSAASPRVDGNLVFIAGGGAGRSMLAFNKDSGELAWKTGDDGWTHATPVIATIGGVRQVIFMMQSGLVSLDCGTGKQLWTFAFPYRTCTGCSPIVAGDIVVCTAGYDIGGAACKVSKSGEGFKAEELWRVKGNNAVASLWSTPIAKDGFLYGMITFKKFGKGPLKCVDASTGEVKWQQAGFGSGQVLLAGNCLVALSDTGEAVLVDPSPTAYKELARFKAIDGKCWSSPALSDGKLYVRSTKEGACFDLSPAK